MSSDRRSEISPESTLLGSHTLLSESVYENAPDLHVTLAHLEASTAQLAKSVSESVFASANAIDALSKYSIEHLEGVSHATQDLAVEITASTSQATAFLLKCVELEKQLTLISRFEEKLKKVQVMLGPLETLVDERIAAHQEKIRLSRLTVMRSAVGGALSPLSSPSNPRQQLGVSPTASTSPTSSSLALPPTASESGGAATGAPAAAAALLPTSTTSLATSSVHPEISPVVYFPADTHGGEAGVDTRVRDGTG